MKRFAIVGCGRVSGLHAENINRIGRLVAACDVVKERAAECAEAYGISAYYSLDDLLAAEKDLDVIVVCTPNGLHAEHIIKSLQAGKHVVTESPMCLTKAAAWQIAETEKFCRRRLFVAQTVRYYPSVRALQNRFKHEASKGDQPAAINGILQTTVRSLTGWRGTAFPGGGLLYALFSNCIELAILLYGEPEVANGFVTNGGGNGLDVEDSGAATLRFANGLSAALKWEAAAGGNSGRATVTVAQKNEAAVFATEDLEEINLYPLLYNDVSAALEGKETGVPGVFDGLKTVEAIEKIYKGIR